MTDALIGCLFGLGALASALTALTLRRPAPGIGGHGEVELAVAQEIAERHGEDSLSPFILRPDKSFHFAPGGVLAYQLVGETAVISADPVACAGSAAAVLASFQRHARGHGWRIALWGASERHLDEYRALGLRATRIGEEAFVDPSRFTLEGRSVRKLRQSVHRAQRRGWELTLRTGAELDAALEREIDAVEDDWQAKQPRILGFAMSMGAFRPRRRPDDVYLLARAPEGELRAVMRFAAHCGKLSLDTMRRVGETPNGLNEALVCRALEFARERGVCEVSLNYAGLAHLLRCEDSARTLVRARRRVLLWLFARHFQLERLVRFNEKFKPEWRPRYLVYESRRGFPRTALRVLQAEGYVPAPRRLAPAPRGGAAGQRLADRRGQTPQPELTRW